MERQNFYEFVVSALLRLCRSSACYCCHCFSLRFSRELFIFGSCRYCPSAGGQSKGIIPVSSVSVSFLFAQMHDEVSPLILDRQYPFPCGRALNLMGPIIRPCYRAIPSTGSSDRYPRRIELAGVTGAEYRSVLIFSFDCSFSASSSCSPTFGDNTIHNTHVSDIQLYVMIRYDIHVHILLVLL